MNQPSNEPLKNCVVKGGLALLNLTGLLLLLGCLVGLYFNETAIMGANRGLAKARSAKSVAPNAVDPANEGKLIHVAGQLTVDRPLVDAEFGVSAEGLVLKRKLEMFQWVQVENNENYYHNGERLTRVVYNYAQRWSAKWRDHTRFERPAGHENPPTIPGLAEPDWKRLVHEARLGAFTLTQSQLNQVSGEEVLYARNNPAPLPTSPTRGPGQLMEDNGWVYFGKDPKAPALGDVRVYYSVVRARELTIVAAQAGESFAPFPIDKDYKVDVVAYGVQGLEEALDDEGLATQAATWFFRLCLAVLTVLGVGAAFLALRRLPGLGTAGRAGWPLFALMGGMGLVFLVIGAAWVVPRPLTGIAALVLGVVLLSGLLRLGAGAKARDLPPAA